MSEGKKGGTGSSLILQPPPLMVMGAWKWILRILVSVRRKDRVVQRGNIR